MSARKPRVGFAGVGWIGRNRLEMVESFDQPLSQDLDSVVNATPSAQHAEQAIAAFDRGPAVFCQKPVGRNADEAQAVVAAANRADRLAAGQRFDPECRFLVAASSVLDALYARAFK